MPKRKSELPESSSKPVNYFLNNQKITLEFKAHLWAAGQIGLDLNQGE